MELQSQLGRPFLHCGCYSSYRVVVVVYPLALRISLIRLGWPMAPTLTTSYLESIYRRLFQRILRHSLTLPPAMFNMVPK